MAEVAAQAARPLPPILAHDGQPLPQTPASTNDAPDGVCEADPILSFDWEGGDGGDSNAVLAQGVVYPYTPTGNSVGIRGTGQGDSPFIDTEHAIGNFSMAHYVCREGANAVAQGQIPSSPMTCEDEGAHYYRNEWILSAFKTNTPFWYQPTNPNGQVGSAWPFRERYFFGFDIYIDADYYSDPRVGHNHVFQNQYEFTAFYPARNPATGIAANRGIGDKFNIHGKSIAVPGGGPDDQVNRFSVNEPTITEGWHRWLIDAKFDGRNTGGDGHFYVYHCTFTTNIANCDELDEFTEYLHYDGPVGGNDLISEGGTFNGGMSFKGNSYNARNVWTEDPDEVKIWSDNLRLYAEATGGELACLLE
ncbi:MAG TPA: hypothetical protein VMO47_18660 [Rhodothermales bacterium]|nr:hypothetical protein [Rhodothermales bacterium]